MNLKDLRNRILKGDLSGLLGLGKNKTYIHPAEAAKLIASLPSDVIPQTFISFPVKNQVSIFSYLDFLLQKQIIDGISKEKASNILNELPSDDRFDFYSNLQGIDLSSHLELLSEKNKNEAFDFLGYPKDSIAREVDTNFADIKVGMTIAEANEHLRNNHTDTEAANYIYVTDDNGRLVDDIPVRRLVLNDPAKKIESILDGYHVSLNISDSKETAIDKFKEYDRTVLPVLNNDNVLIGVITVDDMLDIMEQENTKDIQKFGGLEALDYPYVNTSFLTLIKKRAGWLIILFLSEMLTATAMGFFDAEISKAVVLALFVPLIISSGGNSGSQAATLIIRAMAIKELALKDWWFVMRREVFSGLMLGCMLGTIGFIRIALWQNFHWFNYGEYWPLIALTIFFSLIGIVMWGTLSGSMVPMILKRLGFDPAASSAPFVATLVDVTGLVIYFSIAAVILKGTLL
ncbi:MAG TPA: magnesium transporter [Bacteroidia bacterium]|jgi:magnesium transporter|nr:magnesium transporter [Bacteroidia bacterium]